MTRRVRDRPGIPCFVNKACGIPDPPLGGCVARGARAFWKDVEPTLSTFLEARNYSVINTSEYPLSGAKNDTAANRANNGDTTICAHRVSFRMRHELKDYILAPI